MSKRLVIFGASDLAEIANFYFTQDSDYEVAGFTVDHAFIDGNTAFGLPLVPFEDVEKTFPQSKFTMFIAIGYTQLNQARRRKYEEAKAKGYRFATYVSSRASVWPGFSPGENCFILEGNTLEPFSRIGDNVILWSGNRICHHVEIGSHTFLASNVVVSGGTKVGEQCLIGANATLRDHITVGDRCLIGAGALLLGDAEADGVYSASPTERSSASNNLRRN